MVDLNKIKQDIKDAIRANGRGEITGQVLQDILLEVVDTEGQIYKEAQEELAQLAENVSETIEPINVDLSKKADATETLQQISAVEETINKNKTTADNKFAEIENRLESTNNIIATVEKDVVDNKAAADEKIARVEESLDAKADPTGNYPKMSVGFSNNLIGRGEATAEEFTYRASAGMDRSITDDTARVKKIKGNSVVWNQLRDVAIYPHTSTLANITLEITEGSNIMKLSGIHDGTTGDLNYYIMHQFPLIKGVSGHKYICTIRGNKNIALTVFGAIDKATIVTSSIIVTCSKNETINLVPCIASSLPEGAEINEEVSFYCTDLTQMFGAGNEPSTIEEFYARIPSGIDVNAYNEGEIISVNTEAIKTVGFNQWDEQWDLGTIATSEGLVYPSDSIIRSKNFIKVIPNTEYYYTFTGNTKDYANIYFYDKDYKYLKYYSNWNTTNHNFIFTTPNNCCYIKFIEQSTSVYNHDICINISHTGIENGKYKPYTPFTRELPIIKKYFQNGMRSAGTAFDSIEWDSTKQKWVAAQRVGERAYASGDESDATVLTNNTTTLYELAEPIVTEIEEEFVNFDYYVEDFGTEEALSSVPSAPFRADVVYTFNAVDTIRNNYLAIEEMKKQMAQMQNAISAMQTAQVQGEE